MKKTISLIVIIFSLFQTSLLSGQGKHFFNTGEAFMNGVIESIPLEFIYDLPFVKVQINGKEYNFLFDSGAPTVISTKVYKELNLKKRGARDIVDSQKRTKKQIFTTLPEILVGNILFKNIGCAVMDLTVPELVCLKIDGILGANQMQKLFWRVNYNERILEATKDLSNFDLTDFNHIIPFQTKIQKSPYTYATILGKRIKLTIDTGYSGRFSFNKYWFDIENQLPEDSYIRMSGISGVGALGRSDHSDEYYFSIDSLTLGSDLFCNQIIKTGKSDLMGNIFLKNYEFILDWKNRNIYLKSITDTPQTIESFGFSYMFTDNKAFVASKIQDDSNPLMIGDEILNINGINLENLDNELACNYYIERIERGHKEIDITIKRGDETLNFKLKIKKYL